MRKIMFLLAYLICVSSFAQTFTGLTLRSVTQSPYFTKGGQLTMSEGDYNFINLGNAIRTLQAGAATAGGATFSSNVTFTLSGGKSFGKYTNGQTAPWSGLTVMQAIIDASAEYISPNFSIFQVSGQAGTVEIGTTLSGSKTFTWGVNANSGVVPSIDIFDVNTSTALLSGTTNDGTQAQTITTIQLNTDGASQTWRGIGNNTSPAGAFNSGGFTVTARPIRFSDAVSASPTTSAMVRAMSQSDYRYGGGATYNLNSGTTLTKFVVALPSGSTISSVFDLDALGANITSSYVLTGTVNVLDAGGTNRAYNIYEMNIAVPYSSNHRHQVSYN